MLPTQTPKKITTATTTLTTSEFFKSIAKLVVHIISYVNYSTFLLENINKISDKSSSEFTSLIFLTD